MGTLQLSELSTEIKEFHANRDDLTDARVVTVLNLVQERMCRAHDFEELRVLETGTLPFTSTPSADRFLAYTDLSSGNQEPKEIYSFRVIESDSRHAKLRQWSPRQFDQLVPNPEYYATGFPEAYVLWQDKFEFFRIQDQAYIYNLRMTKWPTAFSVSSLTTKSDFSRKDDMLIHLAVSWLFDGYGEYERAKRFFGMFKQQYDEAVLEDMRRPDQEIVAEVGRADRIPAEEYWRSPFSNKVN